MRYGICVPNLAEFSDPRQVAALARRAEEAGWDGFFVWDHVVFAYGVPETADPWVLLTVIAMATERIRLGPPAGLWSGERVDFRGEHGTADGVTFAPVPAQRPRPSVWIGCDGDPGDRGGHRGRRRRAPGWRRPLRLRDHRTHPAADAKETVTALTAAGATSWLEGFRPSRGEYGAALRRIEAGPPA